MKSCLNTELVTNGINKNNNEIRRNNSHRYDNNGSRRLSAHCLACINNGFIFTPRLCFPYLFDCLQVVTRKRDQMDAARTHLEKWHRFLHRGGNHFIAAMLTLLSIAWRNPKCRPRNVNNFSSSFHWQPTGQEPCQVTISLRLCVSTWTRDQ